MHFICQTDPKKVELAIKENEQIRKANEEYEHLIVDEEEKRLAFLREKAIRDEKSIRQGAREEGREEGMKEGRKEKQIEIARELIKLGLNIE